MSFKPLHNRARENGAEWYQIFLAEKLTAEAGGDRDLFLFLLELFKENESGHLRIELDDAGRDILDKYSGYFHSPRSPFVLTGDDRYLYTKRRKAQEDEFLERFETLLSRENHPLVDGDDSFIIQAGAEKGLELSPPVREACLKVNGESFSYCDRRTGYGKDDRPGRDHTDPVPRGGEKG